MDGIKLQLSIERATPGQVRQNIFNLSGETINVSHVVLTYELTTVRQNFKSLPFFQTFTFLTHIILVIGVVWFFIRLCAVLLTGSSATILQYSMNLPKDPKDT